MRRFPADSVTLARFTQLDSYDGSYSLTDPQNFNRYAYVGNDPVNFTDPSGLQQNQACGADQSFAACHGNGGFWGGGIAGGTGWGSDPRPGQSIVMGNFLDLPDRIDRWMGREPTADPTSTAYQTGGWIGFAASLLLPGPGKVKAVSRIKVLFGHGGRHLVGTGLSKRAVETAIRKGAQGAGRPLQRQEVFGEG